MVSSKIILFTSSHFYLGFPQYRALIPELRDYKKVLINVNEMGTKKLDDEFIRKNNVSHIFDSYLELKQIEFVKFFTFKLSYYPLIYWKYKRKLMAYLYKINPAVIITTSDMATSHRVMFTWCKRNRVPYIILQPAFIEGIPEHYGLFKILRYIVINKILGLPIYRKQELFGYESQKSYLFLWGEYFILKKRKRNLFLLGNPAFDILFRKFQKERKIKNAILICTEYLDYFGKDIFDEVMKIYVKAIKSKPEITFYIKVHPRERIEKYKILLPKSRYPNVVVVKEENLYDLFNLCDIQMSVTSFTSFEAAAVGLPIIIIRPMDCRVKFPNHFDGKIDIKVENIEEIEDAINLALSNEYWKKFLDKREIYFKKRLFSTDGMSAKRVANVIKELIK
ncbi:MAG: hypothetical protein ACFE85_03910 [Candidatus Hodarchaeota archaeon]